MRGVLLLGFVVVAAHAMSLALQKELPSQNPQQTSAKDVIRYLHQLGLPTHKPVKPLSKQKQNLATQPPPQDIDSVLAQIQAKAAQQHQEKCLDRNDKVAKLAHDRGFEQLSSCPQLVVKWKSLGKNCSADLAMFGQPETKLVEVCCGTCTSACTDHDSVVKEILASMGHDDLDTCAKAMPMLPTIHLRRSMDLEPFDLPGLTFCDVCCKSCHDPSLAWKQPLGPFDYEDIRTEKGAVGDGLHATDSPRQPYTDDGSPSEAQQAAEAGQGQFASASGPAANAARENYARAVETQQVAKMVENGRTIEKLEESQSLLTNRTFALRAGMNVTVGNKTLSQKETVQFGEGYTQGFFLGYKTGFTLAQEDDLVKPNPETTPSEDMVNTGNQVSGRNRVRPAELVQQEHQQIQTGPTSEMDSYDQGFEEAHLAAMEKLGSTEDDAEQTQLPPLFSLKPRNLEDN